MKTHLIATESDLTACGRIMDGNARLWPSSVTCQNCRRTDEFLRAQEVQLSNTVYWTQLVAPHIPT